MLFPLPLAGKVEGRQWRICSRSAVAYLARAPHFHRQNAGAGPGDRASLINTIFTLARGKNPSQRNALKSVRGSNHPYYEVGTRWRLWCSQFGAQASGNAACVALKAKQEDSLTGAKENR